MKKKKSKTLASLKTNNPEKDISPELEGMAEDLDTAVALDAVAQSEGGKVLVDNLLQDIVTTIEQLCADYETVNPTVLIARCAGLNIKIAVLRSIARAKDASDNLRSMLDEALKE